MVKYALRHFRTLDVVPGITVDESAVDDFCDMMEWTREEFFNATVKVDE